MFMEEERNREEDDVMQLNKLDKKAIIELKDEIDDLERRVEELSVIRLKNDLPLEIILREHTYFKEMLADGNREGEHQTRQLLGGDACYHSMQLEYSCVLESGKIYTVPKGIVVPYALKIIEGTGVFELRVNNDIIFLFPVIEGDKYVLFPLAFVGSKRSNWCVKEQEGHIRYTCAMSTFSNPVIEEVIK